MENNQNSQQISSYTSSTYAEKAIRNMAVKNSFNEVKPAVQKKALSVLFSLYFA